MAVGGRSRQAPALRSGSGNAPYPLAVGAQVVPGAGNLYLAGQRCGRDLEQGVQFFVVQVTPQLVTGPRPLEAQGPVAASPQIAVGAGVAEVAIESAPPRQLAVPDPRQTVRARVEALQRHRQAVVVPRDPGRAVLQRKPPAVRLPFALQAGRSGGLGKAGRNVVLEAGQVGGPVYLRRSQPGQLQRAGQFEAVPGAAGPERAPLTNQAGAAPAHVPGGGQHRVVAPVGKRQAHLELEWRGQLDVAVADGRPLATDVNRQCRRAHACHGG